MTEIKPGYFEEDTKTLVQKALKDAWIPHEGTQIQVYSQTMGEFAKYDLGRESAVLSAVLGIGGCPLGASAAMAVSCACDVPTLLSEANIFFAPDQRSRAFFKDETYYDRIAERAGLPVGRNYLIFSPNAAANVASVLGGFSDVICVIGMSAETAGSSEKRIALTNVFKTAVARRSSHLASWKQVGKNLVDDVSREGMAIAAAAVVMGSIMGVPALVMSGLVIAFHAIYPKKNPLRNPALDIPESVDPDMKACRIQDGSIMFGMNLNGVKRLASADPSAMAFLVDETQRLVLMPEKKVADAPAPAPKQG